MSSSPRPILQNVSSLILASGITLAAIKSAQRSGRLTTVSAKTSLILSIIMTVVLRQFLRGPSGKLIKNPEAFRKQKKDTEEYDYIIVGGGTAGCVLAARLSEDPSVKVLLIESGISGKELIFTRIPVAYSMLFHSKHIHNFYTEPQDQAKGKKKYWPRGKMLGGCSSVNAQMAQYGAPGDFDEWAGIIQDESWSWTNFSKYFNKFEKYAVDPDHPDVDITVKGVTGPMRIGFNTIISEGSKEFVKSCTEVGIPFSPDFNTSKGTLGVNKVLSAPGITRSTWDWELNKSTVTYVDDNKARVSSETGYLTDDVLARPNLKVLLRAHVTKLVTEKDGEDVKVVGVEFSRNKKGATVRVRGKEIVVSGGAVHSPQLLMLSGIGPAEHLAEHKIPVVKDLPGVGSNLVDHPVVDLYFKNKMKDSPTHIKPKGPIDLLKLGFSAGQYLLFGNGTLATNFGEAAAFIRTDDPKLYPESEYPDKIQDSTSAAGSPDLEIFSTPVAYKEHGEKMFPMHTFSIHVCLLRPMSKGTLRLKSANPWDDPIMDPKYLTAKEDVARLVRGVKLILKISKTAPLADRLDQSDKSPSLDHQTHKKTDEELEELVRERVETLYHPASTCRMAPLEQGGVVDAKLRVYGVKGLRVCDASIFPEIVSGHTVRFAGAVLAAAEHLADIIKAERKTLV
ncbi:hypothetical protein CVT24_004634 [Panaeolus cyanescens]|uniref:pyranose dehydrogenase (acceptor) n=1 Tax=Panaeolus cyanescens TaxID=181874 RepID=A0A409YSI9_9AGAR|nr:hypothetical protein CVT24_004634 [Panaeolus cyanescens]